MVRKLKAHYLLGKTALPEEICEEINTILRGLEPVTDKEEYLRRAYDIISSRFEGGRIKTISRLFDLWATGVEDLWNRSGFMHCTNQNYLLTVLLIKSGLFTADDIRIRWTTIWLFSPHQYLEITVGENKTVEVDCWARHYGVPFGSYATGFNTSTHRAFVE